MGFSIFRHWAIDGMTDMMPTLSGRKDGACVDFLRMRRKDHRPSVGPSVRPIHEQSGSGERPTEHSRILALHSNRFSRLHARPIVRTNNYAQPRISGKPSYKPRHGAPR